MKNQKNNQIDYWEVVNIDEESQEITMLDYLFKHSDGFMGATGSVFAPVSKQQLEERMDNASDYLADIWKMAVQDGNTTMGLEEWAEMVVNTDGPEAFFDLSYQEHWGKIREAGDFPEDKYPIFECIGGGRCFDKSFKGNVNPELSKLIRKYESGKA